jgi:hypothetical protein
MRWYFDAGMSMFKDTIWNPDHIYDEHLIDMNYLSDLMGDWFAGVESALYDESDFYDDINFIKEIGISGDELLDLIENNYRRDVSLFMHKLQTIKNEYDLNLDANNLSALNYLICISPNPNHKRKIIVDINEYRKLSDALVAIL